MAESNGGTNIVHNVTTPSLVPASIKLEKPTTFNGRHTDLENFLFQVDQYVDMVNLTGSNAVKFVVSLLRGDALTWWRMYVDSAGGHANVYSNLDLDVLKSELTSQFSDIDRETHLRDKLFSIK